MPLFLKVFHMGERFTVFRFSGRKTHTHLFTCYTSDFFFKNILFIYLFIYLLTYLERREEREKERERNIDARQKHWLAGCLSYVPQTGTEPITQASALTGNWTSNLSLCRAMPNQLSNTSQGTNVFLCKGILYK